MSTVSGTTDVSIKYQRLAAEFVKVRSQLNILKTAVIDEKSRNEHLRNDALHKDSQLRKITDENESLNFRNVQLVKRVEALQNSLDELTKLQLSKGKKKQREANLRLFVNLDGTENSNLPGASNQNTARFVVEQELERKVEEISTLHSKIFDLEQNGRKEIDDLNDQISELKKENSRLKSTENVRKNNVNVTNVERNRETICHNCQQNNVQNDNDTSHQIVPNNNQPVVSPVTHDARLYADGLLTVAKSLLSAFSTIFTLLEQRSVLYPYDINLEVLPESFKTFGQEMVLYSTDFHEKITKLDQIQTKVNESDDLSFIDASSKALWSDLCQSFKLVHSYLQNSLIVVIRAENEVPFCSQDLEELNLMFEQHFLIVIKNLIELLSKPLPDLFQLKFRHIFVDRLSHLQGLLEELERLFKHKILFEKGIPTASKKMKCVNECILKAFEQISQALIRGFGMISDTNALEHLRLALQNDQSVVNDVTPKESTPLAEAETVGIVVNEEIAIEKDRLSEELQNTKEKLTKAMNDKSEWEATVHAMEQELDVLRSLRDEQTRAADLADPHTKLAQHSLEEVYKQKIKQLALDLTFAKSEALYFKEECEALLVTGKMLKQDYSRLNEPCAKCESLNEALLATQLTFEEQMRELYDRLADQSRELEEQREEIHKFKFSGSTSPMSSTGETLPRENSFKRNIRRMVGK
ncbi:unnamed protein product [Bursaphelenchus okinawaensis]|uniref:Protein phosphatase 1 regulatory subunit 21 n=1 Tax=Bursaphelenchus okinawaensis TaxID=465554 RepID=A0A811L9G1_9BILA|nr:unnamed protein product [Bursaphelenchus okinawaensis]CAG9119819.1 unnamed protein product [Bursaphelenchus okinawaensis]